MPTKPSHTAHFILRNRRLLIAVLILLTILIGSRVFYVEKSRDYVNAMPQNSTAAHDYTFFKKHFPASTNSIIVGVQSAHFFRLDIFEKYLQFAHSLRALDGVESALGVQDAIVLDKSIDDKNTLAGTPEHFIIRPLFTQIHTQAALDRQAQIFRAQPLYKGLLYNPESHSYLLLLNIDAEHTFTKKRDRLVAQIDSIIAHFNTQTKTTTHVSGLPYIRTKISDIVSHEMTLLIGAAVVFLILIIGIIFRSFAYILITLVVLAVSLIWTFASIDLMGFKITLLTGIAPALIIIIGVPNCIYFFNKYRHARTLGETQDKAIATMLREMGHITLFCNLTAALGFFVFIFTSSALLREFSLVASVNIFILFFLSYLIIPIGLSYTKNVPIASSSVSPFARRLPNVLMHISAKYNRFMFVLAGALIVLSVIGILRIYANSFILDDVPKDHILYKDLHFFEQEFGGVMPLDILIDTKKKNAATSRLALLDSIASFTRACKKESALAKPLSIIDALSFARQMFYNGDSSFYALPGSFDISFLAPYLKNPPTKISTDSVHKTTPTASSPSALHNLLENFTDTNKQILRVNFRVADIGQNHTQQLLDRLRSKLYQTLDTARYRVIITGNTIAFLEGNSYLIAGLKESILWAVFFMVIIMFYLFRSVRMVIISLIPNIIPIALSAGLVGFLGIPLKPSVVIVFSISLGIAIDITIRLLMHYQKFLRETHNVGLAIRATMDEAGASVLYTTLTLIGGFLIFMSSSFESIRYLGGITTFTLLVAGFSNLLLLPALLEKFAPKKIEKHK